MCGWVQYFSCSPYSRPVMTAQLICSQQCVAGYNILAGHYTAIQSWEISYLLTVMCGWVQYFSWSPYSYPVMTAQLICSQQCVAWYNILAGHYTAIQSWEISYLLTVMCGWVQYFSWSPYSHPVMTAQLICSQQCVAGYYNLAGYHTAIQSWQLNSSTHSHQYVARVQYFSWSPYSHPDLTAQLSAHSNVWLGTIF